MRNLQEIDCFCRRWVNSDVYHQISCISKCIPTGKMHSVLSENIGKLKYQIYVAYGMTMNINYLCC